MSFSQFDLAPELLKAIHNCGFTAPTPVQAAAIPAALEGRDLLATAQTGTGKTAAFMLPALQNLLDTPPAGRKGAPRILVLTPTRELAAQVLDATRSFGTHMHLRSASLLGGSSYGDQFRALNAPLDLVVATPGRLMDHMERRSIDLSRVQILVLDEADRMLDMGFKEAVETITAATPSGRQTLLFTATMNGVMTKLAMELLREPLRIDIAGKTAPAEGIEQRLHVVDNLEHKQRVLSHLVAAPELKQAIIFSATKRSADDLAQTLSAQGHRAAALHGDMTQGARNRTLRDLRRGRVRLLVATDVAARGIDVAGISHVINFDLPMFAEDYVHRIGRTGRAGATGTAISFASRHDLVALKRIQRLLGNDIPHHVIAGLEPTRPLETPRPAGKPRPWGKKPGGDNRRPGDRPAWKGRKPNGNYDPRKAKKGGAPRRSFGQ